MTKVRKFKRSKHFREFLKLKIYSVKQFIFLET